MASKLGMTVDLCMTYIYAHASADDLDLDARLQWVGKGKKISLTELSRQLSKQQALTCYNGRPFLLVLGKIYCSKTSNYQSSVNPVRVN